MGVDENSPERAYNFDITPFKNELCSVKVFVNSGLSTTMTDVDSLRLQLKFRTHHRIKEELHSGVSFIANQVSAINSNQVKFSWYYSYPPSSCEEGNHPDYEIQVLRLHNMTEGSSYEQQTQIKGEVDWSNATSIHAGTGQGYIILTLAEGTGFYVWRVRPIGSWYTGGVADDRNWGEWTSHSGLAEGTLVDISRGAAIGASGYLWSANTGGNGR